MRDTAVTADAAPPLETAPNIGAVSSAPRPAGDPPFPQRQAVAPPRRIKKIAAVRAMIFAATVHRHSLRGE